MADVYEKLKKIKFDSLVVCTTEEILYFRRCIELIEVLVRERGMAGILITMNIPIEHFSRELSGLDTGDIWFVDCISAISGTIQPEISNCITVSHPINEGGIMVAVATASRRLRGRHKFVMLVSPHVLNEYWDINKMGLFLYQYKTFLAENSLLNIIMLKKEKNKLFEAMVERLADYLLVS